ncbi:hypothetical protein DFA_01137 [Cavenderia fasciculata]|uniref:Eukaryotic translation initiation factor 2D n=1 Tax=Cavenderia fasciculata TaxID=261658 RepID=F4PQZ3_CACFS|nr:uncharacterized protein DFA_01137 [Cavenderia fasciculata]EGG21258.1 hypothetical protein DFA_01137 [Cavenderia fasciculata]|eukprot:XP_004359108.1 hypothetical protein DFA_01137 [Cavenderia fasciculata]
MKSLFKKSFSIQSQSLMSGSDKKKLKEKLSYRFKSLCSSNSSITADTFDQVLQNKKDLGVVKIHNPQATLYCQLGDPLFFEYSNQLYPSIYTLYKLPNLLPIVLIHAPVFKYISTGADLMFRGIINFDQVPETEGSLVSICIKGCPQPIAFGQTLKFTKKDKIDQSGKAVQIIHHVDDALWNYGSKSLQFNFQEEIEEEEEKENEEEEKEQEEEEEEDDDDQEEEEEEMKEKLEKLNIKDTTTTSTVSNNPSSTISKEKMDEIIETSFMGTIKVGIKDGELPMVLKTFFNKYMLYYAPSNEPEINIAKSSYKKVSKLLEAMKKRGLVETSEPTPGNIMVTRIVRSHPDYKSFVPLSDQDIVGDKPSQTKGDDDDQGDIDDPYGSTGTGLAPIKSIVPVYPLPNTFFEYAIEGKKYYTFQPEIKTMVGKYIVDHKLDDPIYRANIKLDESLANMLGREIGQSVGKNQLLPLIKEQMKLYLEISRSDGSVQYIQSKKIEIYAKKVANKYILEVHNLHLFSISLKEFAKDGMKEFAASTTVTQGIGKNYNIVKIQGNDADRVSTHLQQKYHIPSFCIDCIIHPSTT